jgi:hypothetical protein
MVYYGDPLCQYSGGVRLGVSDGVYYDYHPNEIYFILLLI